MKVKLYVFLIISYLEIFSQSILIDDFEKLRDWKIIKSDGVEANISLVNGKKGNAIKYEFDFTKGAGYGGFQRFYSLSVPENFQFTFYLRGSSPNNNFEIKFLDQSGENVWWMNNRDFKFSPIWQKFTVKKRHIDFAWGPIENKLLKKIDRIEFTISSFNGGKGWIEIDELEFQELPEVIYSTEEPKCSALSEFEESFAVKNIFEENSKGWLSKKNLHEEIVMDFQQVREIGGFVINWDKINYPKKIEIYFSNDKNEWEKVYSVENYYGNRTYVRLLNKEARYVSLRFFNSPTKFFGIKNLRILKPSESENLNNFFINIAKDFPRGYYPRYFYKEKSYWNIIGVNGDEKEALINEDGMIEIDKKQFSIEPFLQIDSNFYTWDNVKIEQQLEKKYLPVPIVKWEKDNFHLEIKTFASGKENDSSAIYIIYKLANNTKFLKKGSLFLLVRPFQVNPYYQWLNIQGGVTEINSIEIGENIIKVNDNKYIHSLSKYDDAYAMKFNDGNIIEAIKTSQLNKNKNISDSMNLASAALKFNFELQPNEEKVICIAIPFYDNKISIPKFDNKTYEIWVQNLLDSTICYWEKKVSKVKFDLPSEAEQIINTYKSNLAYILINRDRVGIQPGSRSYERSWIRDGSLTSSALLKSGIFEEVKDFIQWYSKYQYENGKIPCVVDKRGGDPVPENDSHGEFIFLVKQYFNFTHDTTFLKQLNKNILLTVDYIKYLIDQRSTDYYKYGNDSIRSFYGLMPESISHEGYSAKPMHSYWDDFFTLKGLNDAVEIQKILRENYEYEKIKAIRDKFEKDVYNSINLVIKYKNISYIPGCAELGDFDPTSTTIAVSPANQLKNLPSKYLQNTFEKYYDFFKKRAKNEINWINYTPYENRIIGSFILLKEPLKAYELINYFVKDQRPQGWNHWAEVVWKDYRFPGFIGDMPHTWVGSDFINAIRTLFVIENDYDSTLVIGAGIPPNWLNQSISIENLYTYYGNISYSLSKLANKISAKIYGEITMPSNGIFLKNPIPEQDIKQVIINGNNFFNFSNDGIPIKEFPAKIEIIY